MKQCMSSWGSGLKEFKRELVSVVCGTVVLTVHINEQLESWEEGGNLGGQVSTEETAEAEVKSPRANGPADLEVKYLGAYVPADSKMQSPEADDPDDINQEVNQFDADTLYADNWPILRRDQFLRRFDVMS